MRTGDTLKLVHVNETEQLPDVRTIISIICIEYRVLLDYNQHLVGWQPGVAMHQPIIPIRPGKVMLPNGAIMPPWISSANLAIGIIYYFASIVHFISQNFVTDCGFRHCSRNWNVICTQSKPCTNLIFIPFETASGIIFFIKLGWGNIHRNIFSYAVRNINVNNEWICIASICLYNLISMFEKEYIFIKCRNEFEENIEWCHLATHVK